MVERHESWAASGPVPGGQMPSPASPARPPGPPVRPPSGLFPGLPPRPVFREPHPIRTPSLLAGLGAGVVWLGLFAGLARDLAGYAWWTIVAAVSAWVVAAVLAVLGDRGVAVGVALISGVGLSIAMAFVTGRWITTNDWPLW